MFLHSDQELYLQFAAISDLSGEITGRKSNLIFILRKGKHISLLFIHEL